LKFKIIIIIIIIIDRTLVLDKTIKKHIEIDVAVANSHSFHSTITGKLQTFADLQEAKFMRIWQLKAARIIPIVQSTTAVRSKLHENLKLPNFRRALYILTQKVRSSA
jgi:hypothetical protein